MVDRVIVLRGERALASLLALARETSTETIGSAVLDVIDTLIDDVPAEPTIANDLTVWETSA